MSDLTGKPPNQNGYSGITGRMGLLLAAVLILVAAKPVAGPGRVYIAGQVRDERFGFAFDIPDGMQAESGISGGLYWIKAAKGRAPLSLWGNNSAFWFLEPLADPTDTLASFVKQNLGMDCDADGPDGSTYADSLVALKRFRTTRGFEAVEYSVKVREEQWEGGDDSDSTAAATAPPATVKKSFRVGGPFYIVDLGRPGKPLWVRISPGCYPADAATIRVARAFLNTLQRI